MKLDDIIAREYAIIATEYGCHSIDITYDTDEYDIHLNEYVKAKNLPEAVIDCIKANGEYFPEETVEVWEGKLHGVITEDVIVYVPESWV